jgi:hypothetical protein
MQQNQLKLMGLPTGEMASPSAVISAAATTATNGAFQGGIVFPTLDGKDGDSMVMMGRKKGAGERWSYVVIFVDAEGRNIDEDAYDWWIRGYPCLDALVEKLIHNISSAVEAGRLTQGDADRRVRYIEGIAVRVKEEAAGAGAGLFCKIIIFTHYSLTTCTLIIGLLLISSLLSLWTGWALLLRVEPICDLSPPIVELLTLLIVFLAIDYTAIGAEVLYDF